MKVLSTASPDGRKAERVLKKAVARVMEENRRLGIPVAVMRKGRAVTIPAEKALQVVREERAAYRAARR